jgi:hypothetical protein
MQGGRRVQPAPSLDEIMAHTRRELDSLPEPLRRLEPGATYAADVAEDLVKLAADVDARLQKQDTLP